MVTERISDIANGNQVIRMFDSRKRAEEKFLEKLIMMLSTRG